MQDTHEYRNDELFQMLEQEGCSELLLYGKNSQNRGSYSNMRIFTFEGNLVLIMGNPIKQTKQIPK